ncbi:MAG TPA: MFS transporter, partial [Anaerolineae bacterium]|nr:MFS transporter [Anaerolineae bacterium]
GSIVAVSLFYAQSQVTNLVAFYLIWLGLGVTMAMVLYQPAFVVTAKWFEQRRKLALAIITFAAGFASTIFLPLTANLLTQFGRVQTQIYLAMLLGVITIPLHGLVLRHRPKSLGLQPDGTHQAASTHNAAHPPSKTTSTAVRDRTFWILALAFGLNALASVGIHVHMIALLLGRGFSAEKAAFMAGGIGVAKVLGRIIYVPIGERIAGKQMAMLLFAGQALAFVLLWLGSAEINGWVFILLFGTVQGATTLIRPTLIAELYGAASFGGISGMLTVTQRLFSTAAPFGIGYLYTRWDAGYSPILLVLFALSGLALLAMSTIRPHPLTTQKVR